MGIYHVVIERKDGIVYIFLNDVQVPKWSRLVVVVMARLMVIEW